MSAPEVGRVQRSVFNCRVWHIASRWQEFEGEMRASVLRGILVVMFYSVQLIHHLTLATMGDTDRVFHRQVTFSAIAWLFVSMAVFLSLRVGFMPSWLKYLTTSVDLGLVTLLAWLSHGPASPLVCALFLVLVLASIRFRIGLIWFATLGAMICYMLLVGAVDASWFDTKHETPILTQAITLCSLGCTGIVLGQVVRSARTMAESFSERSMQAATQSTFGEVKS